MKNAIGAEIRKRRKALKMSLEELAHRVGTDSGNLSRAERGIQGISDDLLKSLVSELGCTVADLHLGDSDNHMPTPIGTRRLPLYTQSEFEAMAHRFTPGASLHLICDIDLSANAYAIELNDPAMSNEIRPFDRLILDPAVCPIPSDLVAVRSHRTQKTYLRKYSALGFLPESGDLLFEAKPTESDYPCMRSDSDLLEVLAVVIEHRKSRKKI